MTRNLRASLITLGDPDTMTGGYLYHRRVAELGPRHGLEIRFASVPAWPFPWPALGGPGTLSRASEGVDVVLVDSIAAAAVAPWLLARHPPVPLVGILHQPPGGIDGGRVRAGLQAPLDRMAYRRMRLLIAASEPLAKQLERERLGPPVTVVPPGRDVGSEPSSTSLELRRDGPAFLFVGNWIARKGLLELLEAFARLPAEAGSLHLVGDPGRDRRYARRVRRALDQPRLAGRVIVHGGVPKGSMARYYAAADVFVLPSVREPYGTAYGEAMAAGLPVVGYRAGNLPFLADHDREGLLVDPGDVAGLSDALRALALDGELRARLGRAARTRAQSLPTWDEITELLARRIRDQLI